jgi:prepilin peptidase CpaA
MVNPLMSLPPMMALLAMVTVALIAAWTDWRSWRIPNALVAGGMAAAWMLSVFAHDGIGLQACLLGGATGFLMLLPFYLAKGMGAGDVKLLATLGMLAGPGLIIVIGMMSFLIGGVWSLALLMAGSSPWGHYLSQLVPSRRRQHPYLQESPKLLSWSKGSIPYGVVIALGTVAAILGVRAI